LQIGSVWQGGAVAAAGEEGAELGEVVVDATAEAGHVLGDGVGGELHPLGDLGVGEAVDAGLSDEELEGGHEGDFGDDDLVVDAVQIVGEVDEVTELVGPDAGCVETVFAGVLVALGGRAAGEAGVDAAGGRVGAVDGPGFAAMAGFGGVGAAAFGVGHGWVSLASARDKPSAYTRDKVPSRAFGTSVWPAFGCRVVKEGAPDRARGRGLWRRRAPLLPRGCGGPDVGQGQRARRARVPRMA
jgi:hypothetical protein